MKKCCRCNEIKSFDDFSKSSSIKDGYKSACKACLSLENKHLYSKTKEKRSKQIKEYYIKNKDKLIRYCQSWAKSNTEKIKKHQEKYRQTNREKINRTKIEYYNSNVIARTRKQETSKKWLQLHPEKNQEYHRKRRAIEASSGGNISNKEWEDLMEKYNYSCLSCGKTGVKLTLDHVVPLVLGGSHSIDNAQPLCSSCNSKKHIKIIDYRIGVSL